MNLEEKIKELELRIEKLEKVKDDKKHDAVVTDYAPQVVKDFIKRDKERRGVK